MKKRKKNLAPRCKRMKQSARLQSARHWLLKYEGENIICGYSKHFGVNRLCAALELRMLGYKISDEQIEQYKQAEQAKQIKALSKKQKNLENQKFDIELFEYFTGYWDDDYEWLELKDSSDQEDCDLPF